MKDDASHPNRQPGTGHQKQLSTEAFLASWPTPTKGDGDGGHLLLNGATATGQRLDGTKATVSLAGVAKFASWPSPRAMDGEKNVRTADGSLREMERKGCAQDLMQAATLAGWPTPNAIGDSTGGGQVKNALAVMSGTPRPSGAQYSVKLRDFVLLARLTDSGQEPVGYLLGPNGWETHPASGQLNPSLSRWLMGLPAIFDVCAVTASENLKRRKADSRSRKAPRPECCASEGTGTES
jgi:hypothetical protein